MEAKKLTLQDIHIGDYVQEFSEITKNFSMPMYVDSIFSDGDIYLNFNGNEADPWETKVKDVYDIPIDYGILPHFGFFEVENHLFKLEVGECQIAVHVFKVCNYFLAKGMLANKNGKAVLLGVIDSIRMLQHLFYEETKQPLKLNFE